MPSLLSTALGRFRAVSGLEGLSYLVLVLVAMPLKYAADLPAAVSLVGRLHGGLFVLFVLTLLLAQREREWSAQRAMELLGLSLVPFGALWIDRACQAETSP